MRTADFENSPAGHLVPTVYNQRAFVPNALPPKFDLSRVALQPGAAMAATGQLRGACRLLDNPYILIRPLQRLEAQTSSAMEGTYTTADALPVCLPLARTCAGFCLLSWPGHGRGAAACTL
ncbi:MAG: hypothetical protein GDA53_05350 [Rhodobacteraceae bacterium]|nr:hypothetical protein [Paracoccaceae bacterium]